jgi:hypothetical protein
MSAQTHYTEKLLRRIRELELEYEEQEKLKIVAHKVLVEKLEAAERRILELEAQYRA